MVEDTDSCVLFTYRRRENNDNEREYEFIKYETSSSYQQVLASSKPTQQYATQHNDINLQQRRKKETQSSHLDDDDDDYEDNKLVAYNRFVHFASSISTSQLFKYSFHIDDYLDNTVAVAVIIYTTFILFSSLVFIMYLSYTSGALMCVYVCVQSIHCYDANVAAEMQSGRIYICIYKYVCTITEQNVCRLEKIQQ